MQFNYEIPVEEYAAGQVLYYKASIKGRGVKNAVIAVLFGLLCILVAVFRRTSDWAPILLFLAGSGFIYGGIAPLFPTRHYGKLYRKFYKDSGLAGKSFHAEVDEDGFSVSGNGCTWLVPWTEAQWKGEDKSVFLFTGKGSMFIFGKKYLTDDQQQQIHQLARQHKQLT
jgi:hypothetical protein